MTSLHSEQRNKLLNLKACFSSGIYIANQLGFKKRIAGQEPGSSFDLDDFGEVTSIRYSLHSEALGWIVCFLSCVGWSEDAGYAAGTDEQA